MENTPYLYDTLLRVLGQHANGLDLRHCKTLAWMMVGLIGSKTVSLGSWTPYASSRGKVDSSYSPRY
jgi:signal recognition particle GTPase